MNSLNPQQKQAIQQTQQHCLVLAGAGSGKTRVITEKILHLIKNCNADPAQIIAVTFTNKAAREMQQRLSKMASGIDIKALRISTFHTLGLSILRKEYKKLGYKHGFTIFDSTDAQSLLRELLRDKEVQYQGDEVGACWAISRLKNDLLTPDAAFKQAQTDQDAALALLYSRYQRQLLAYNAMDFDDLIMQPLLLLQSQSDVRTKWQQQIRYLLVDEYQDTNACQYELVKCLLGSEAKLTAVGDDDQSIYAWRGARPENLFKLQEDLPDLQLIKLEQNYRSTGRILKCANHLISQNEHTHEKRLWSAAGHGDPVRILPCESAENEADRVVAEILHLKFQRRLKNKDFAILYRSNHQSRLFESALRLHNLPYIVSGGTAFFDRGEVKDILAYLRLVVNPQDDAAFLRIINTPRREIGASTLEKLSAFAVQNKLNLLEACQSDQLSHALPAAACTRLTRFADWINELALRSRDENAPSLANSVVDSIAYEDWLLNTSKDKDSAKKRMENVNSLLDWIRNIAKRSDEPLLLEKLVDKLSLMDMLEKQDDSDTQDAVQLITLHAAKGLEFPHVFMVGAEENILPHRNSIEEDSLEEERRITYVGITRAEKTLTITYAETRKQRGENCACSPSRFLSELPQDELDWEGSNIIPVEEKKERGNNNIASLRKMLEGGLLP